MSNSLLHAYRRAEIDMVRGEGVYLWDSTGKRYLDFAAGIAVNSLGHCHPHLVAALGAQNKTLWHCSNLYHTPLLRQFADRLVGMTFADRVFFTNSGTEAVETAIKLARLYFDAAGQPERFRIVTAEGGFHGRTLAAISAGKNPRVAQGFGPLVEGFDQVAFNDVAALEAAIGPDTAAIMLEPIQGEGGVRPHSPEYMQAARALCDRHGLLLILDEVQCGYGRPGSLFAYERYGIAPDIVTAAKGIGSGFPLGAVLMTEAVAAPMRPGLHGSTYASNPLAMAAGNAVLDIMQAPGFFEDVRARGSQLLDGLQKLVADHSSIFAQARGVGLMLGLEFQPGQSARDWQDRLCAAGLLTAAAGDHVLRVVPPLIIDAAHIDAALEIFRQVSEQAS